MPSARDLLKKHADRVQESAKLLPQIKRKGPTRPWQENLEQYSDQEIKTNSSKSRDKEFNAENSDIKNPELTDENSDQFNLRSATHLIDEDSLLILGNDTAGETLGETDVPQVVEKRERQGRQSNRSVGNRIKDGEPSQRDEDKTHIELSNTALVYTAAIKEFGFDFAMKVLLVRELANSEGLIHCSQQTMANHLDMSLKSVKRLFDDLCERNAIELYRESDPKTKAPRQYRVLYK
jgi:hypothetical protein